MIQIMGILAFIPVFGLPFILGPIAWIMGRNDLAEMDAGRMDPAGRQATQTGKTCGKLAVIIYGCVVAGIFLLWLTMVIVMFVVYGSLAFCCCAVPAPVALADLLQSGTIEVQIGACHEQLCLILLAKPCRSVDDKGIDRRASTIRATRSCQAS